MDREKVIRDLRYLKSFGRVSNNPQITEIAENAIALLKEQEAELSYREAKSVTHTATKLDDATCPSCGNVIRVRYDYCHYCGQKLDWEGR